MPREIVVNGRFLTRRITGVERYGHEILRCIGQTSRIERPKRALNGPGGHAWEQFILPGKLNRESILWSPANTGPLMVYNQVLTIHDLSPLEHPDWFRTTFSTWYRIFLPLLAKRVKHVLVPSSFVKQKIVRRFHIENVTIAPEGVDTSIFKLDAHQTKYDLPEKYILFVGSLEPRKNLAMLLQAWDEIKDDFKDVRLVIAGEAGRIFRNIDISHEQERVCFIGYVPEEHLPGLYAGALLFVLPSLEEGFGLPVLEAMACGIPVISSNGGALPEIVGKAGLIFKSSDKNGLSQMLKNCLSDKKLRDDLKNKGLARAGLFTWEKTSEIVWKTLNEN